MDTHATPAELFLREHADTHSGAVVPDQPINTDHLLAGLTDDELRRAPHSLNPIAWLWWHMACVEDTHVSCIIAGQPPVLADPQYDWPSRLGVARTDVGEGMTADEVRELADHICLPALREYRDAVGRRTRDLVSRVLWPDRWTTPLTETDFSCAASYRVISSAEAEAMHGYLGGVPRDNLLWWWGLKHNHHHLGQVALVRNVVLRARS